MPRTVAAIAAATALLLTAPAFARDDAALKAAADAYVRHPVVQQMIDGMWSGDTMRSALVAQMRARGRTLRDDRIDALTRIVREELARLSPQIWTSMVDAVVKNYTLGEIRALNRFIDTGLGTRAVAKLLREGRGGCSRYGSCKALRKFPDAGRAGSTVTPHPPASRSPPRRRSRPACRRSRGRSRPRERKGRARRSSSCS